MHFLTKPQIQTKSNILIPTKRLIMTVIAGRGNSLLLATWLLKSTFSIVWRFFLFSINHQLRATGSNFMTRNTSWVFLMLQSQQYRWICSSLVNSYLNMYPATPHCSIILGSVTRAEYKILVMGDFLGSFSSPSCLEMLTSHTAIYTSAQFTTYTAMYTTTYTTSRNTTHTTALERWVCF